MTNITAVPASQYHADELGEQPSLSASIAKILVSQSPRHAWTQHPKLNPAYKRDEDDKFAVGTVAHAVILEGRDPLNVVEVCEFNDWKTKAAQAQRDEAREAGKIPLLGKHYFDVLQMVEAAREQISAYPAAPPLLTDGKPEQTLTWNEPDGTFCKARLDWLRDDLAAVDDIKCTTRSAEQSAWVRSSMLTHGYDFSAAFYLRGLSRLTGAEAQFRWIVIETYPPFALSVIEPGPDVLALANAKVDYALRIWNECLANDTWPGYPKRVATAELPAWEETRWLEKEGVIV